MRFFAFFFGSNSFDGLGFSREGTSRRVFGAERCSMNKYFFASPSFGLWASGFKMKSEKASSLCVVMVEDFQFYIGTDASY